MTNNFDFTSEMVYGKKHLNKLDYDINDYKFVQLVTDLYKCELNNLHNSTSSKYDLFTELGKDSHTVYHNKFYKKLDEGWDELKNEYDKFIKQIVLPYLGLNEALVQKFPTFRIQLPNNVAIVINHYDSDENHKHPTGEINFITALTNMYDTNTVMVEKMPRFGEYAPVELKAGETISFNGNKCNHHNNINKTGKTRVSWDFRVLPLNYYNKNNNLQSVTTNSKYIDGGYYKRVKLNNNSNYKSKDIWDKEKTKFNSTMIKYNVKDAWGVVDIFEKRIATYAGSKYAVSVDCCTNALFLCLKYLKASGSVIIPSKTWISVPCTIIHAGCNVTFEDYEWSGAYQLKPYPIYDGAVRIKKGMYKSNTYHCLSFHIRKHIPIGKGGMILTDDKEAYDWFRTVRYEGRTMSEDGINYKLYKEDTIKSLGWNMYMTPEQAARGLELFENIKDDNPDQESSGTCKNLEELGIYQEEKLYYSYDYWFNNPEHDNWDQGGKDYYVNTFYENIIMKLEDIPKEGKILILGTHNCYSFDKLCKFFGYERCIGYDLHNPTNHPNVLIKNCIELTEDDKIDIAFCHNDLGNYSSTPKLKEHAQKWAAKNIISGGYMLSNNNYNRAKVKNIEIMEDNGFEVKQLIDLQYKYDLQELSNKEFSRIEGYMLSKKK
tara:strand:+ start:1665 stop:3644 length:1980 start_codon:yes stop_codon:yes gene_type:complete